MREIQTSETERGNQERKKEWKNARVSLITRKKVIDKKYKETL